MGDYYLNVYTPLACNVFGRAAADRFGIPPFVDGSIRREPDLEHARPSISCLCPAGKFAPRLRLGDVVMYVTKKRKYGSRTPQRRLSAVLLVDHIEPSHKRAANWYRRQGLALPSNCMIDGNLAKPLEQSHRIHRDAKVLDDERLARRWDAEYALRAKNCGVFVVCRPLFRNLSRTAPEVIDDYFDQAFGRLPGIQNPGKLDPRQMQKFLDFAGVPVELSCQ